MLSSSDEDEEDEEDEESSLDFSMLYNFNNSGFFKPLKFSFGMRVER